MLRPALTEASFLAHVFSPKKNAQPTGLRKTALKTSKGRKAARVKAFNRMTSVKQEVLKRSGQRDAYLRGDITFTQAKQRLRAEAVIKNIVKPLRSRNKPNRVYRPTTTEELLNRIADNIWRHTNTKRHTRRSAIDHNVKSYLDSPTEDMTSWSYDKISSAAKGTQVDGKTYLVFTDNGTKANPFWYH